MLTSFPFSTIVPHKSQPKILGLSANNFSVKRFPFRVLISIGLIPTEAVLIKTSLAEGIGFSTSSILNSSTPPAFYKIIAFIKFMLLKMLWFRYKLHLNLEIIVRNSKGVLY